MTFFGSWRTTFAAYFLFAVAAYVTAQQPSQDPSAQQQLPATQIEAIREPGKPSKLILLYPPQSPEAGLALGSSTGPSAQDESGSGTTQQNANSAPTSNGQGSPANLHSSVPLSDPFNVVTSNGTWTNQAGGPTLPVTPLPFNVFDVLGWASHPHVPGPTDFLPIPIPTPDFPGLTSVLSYLYDPPALGCDYPGCPRVVSPAGDVIDPGAEGAPTICPWCPPYHEPGSGPILLNVPTPFNSPGPVDSGALNSSNRTVIKSQLVSDFSPPANGITIETPQFLPNPSPDGIEISTTSAPISFTSALLPNSPPTAAPSRAGWSMGNSASGGGGHFDWTGFLTTSLQLFDVGVSAYAAAHPAKISVPPAPARATAPARGGKATPSNSNQSNSNSACGPGYYINPNMLAGLAWIPGQSVCVPNGTTQSYH